MASRTPSLANIPDELLGDITYRVARSSVIDAASLGMVCRAFRRHWNTQCVRKECNLSTLPFVPAIGDSAKLRSLAVAMTRFCQAGNPRALFREGITSFLDNRRMGRENEGLTQLEAVAANGHMQARFLYGMILVCTDLNRTHEGFDILSTLRRPTLLESMRRMARLRDVLISNYLVNLEGGKTNAVNFLAEYLCECECPDPDGNRDYMDDAFGWPFQTIAYDPPNSSMCDQCFWDCETNILFHRLYAPDINPYPWF